jgi:DNA-binding CsgD family transcriptional regulator
MLYRAKKSVFFNDNEAECLHALWKHLLRAFALNLKNALKEIDTDKSQYGFALVNSQGLVEMADSRFSALLGLEWPDSQVNSALEQIIQKLKKNPAYRGKRIHISMYDKFGYMVCAASRLPLLLTLSPSEQSVAERFALGNCYKKIAQQLDMSPYTVRNHIANVYRKLGINDKATLASLITSSSRQILHITFGLLPIFCAAFFEFDIY